MDYIAQKNKLALNHSVEAFASYGYKLSSLTDQLIIDLASSQPNNNFLILAVGGYGRKELAPHSDIDLLFFTCDEPHANLEAFISKVMYPIWDLNLRSRPLSCNNFQELEKIFLSDFNSQTTLLSSRLIYGTAILSKKFEFWKKNIFQKHLNAFAFNNLILNSYKKRISKYGDTFFLSIPNIKDGVGGIRDLNSLYWLNQLNILLEKDERWQMGSNLLKASQNIFSLRTALHLVQNRLGDYLAHHLTADAAKVLGLSNRFEFMDLYYHSAEIIAKNFNIVFGINEKFKKRFTAANLPQKEIGIFKDLKIKEEFKSFLNSDFYFDDSQTFICSDKSFIQYFENNLQDIYELYYQAPRDPVHIYTVGMHSAMTFTEIKKIKYFFDRDLAKLDFFDQKIKIEPQQWPILMLAALLHDVGKKSAGEGHAEKGAVIAKKIATSWNMPSKDIETLCLLIENHLLLADTATKRDLNDQNLIENIKNRLKSIDNINMLYFLTMADSKATNEGLWKKHRIELIRELLNKLNNSFKHSISEEDPEDINEAISKLLLIENDSLILNKFLKSLPKYYYLSQPIEDIAWHFKVWQQLLTNEGDFTWDYKTKTNDKRQLVIAAKNKHGLLSSLAASISEAGFNILEAKVFSPKGGYALDIFTLSAPPDKLCENLNWKTLERLLKKYLQNNKSVVNFTNYSNNNLWPPKVIVDNHSSSLSTIVEIHTNDKPGLLYALAYAISNLDLSIELAKIDTIGPKVVDVFYLRDNCGRKILNDDIIKKLTDSLLKISQ